MKLPEQLRPLHRIMTDKVPTVSPSATAADAIALIRAHVQEFDSIDYIYVIGSRRALVGVFSIRALFRHPTETPIERFITRSLVSASPDTPPEEIANLALKHGIKAVPIIDENGVFLGVVPNDTIKRTLYREFRRNIFSFAGIRRSHAEFDNTLEIPFLKALEHRLPWLLIGLGGGLVAAEIVQGFETTLEKNLLLAAFIPVVVYLADAIETQLEALMIRDFAVFRKLNFLAYFTKQFGVILVMGAILALGLALAGFLFHHDLWFAITLGVAIFVAALSALFSGLCIPYLFRRLGFDPANASGPIATIIQDILSVLIYFSVAAALL